MQVISPDPSSSDSSSSEESLSRPSSSSSGSSPASVLPSMRMMQQTGMMMMPMPMPTWYPGLQYPSCGFSAGFSPSGPGFGYPQHQQALSMMPMVNPFLNMNMNMNTYPQCLQQSSEHQEIPSPAYIQENVSTTASSSASSTSGDDTLRNKQKHQRLVKAIDSALEAAVSSDESCFTTPSSSPATSPPSTRSPSPKDTEVSGNTTKLPKFIETSNGKLVLLPADYQVDNSTVICGRGKHARKHPGNIRLVSISQKYLQEYSQTKLKKIKSGIVSQILVEVRTAPLPPSAKQQKPMRIGEFVRFMQGRWWRVPEHDAREKVTGVMRDALHTQYKSSSKSKVARRKSLQKPPCASPSSSLRSPTPTESSTPVSSSSKRPSLLAPEHQEPASTKQKSQNIEDITPETGVIETSMLQPLPVSSAGDFGSMAGVEFDLERIFST